MTFALLILSRAALAAPCSVSTSAADLDLALERFERAVVEVDDFEAVGEIALGVLECLEEPIPKDTAARFHQMVAIVAHDVEANIVLTAQAFAAARSADPGYRLDEALIPPGTVLHRMWDDLDAGATEALEPPADGAFYIDGAATDARPVSLPTILQLVGGPKDFSVYLTPGDPTPTYAIADSDPPPPDPDQDDGGRRALPLVVAGAGAAAAGAGAGLYVWNLDFYNTYIGEGCIGYGSSQEEQDQCQIDYQSVLTGMRAGGALMGVGGAGLIGGLVWWAPWSSDREDRAAIRIAPGANGVLVSGRW